MHRDDNQEDPYIPKSMQLEKDAIMDGMYVANLLNRVRQLRDPSPIDQKRWPWELSQNAKDCIVGDPTRKKVDVEFWASENEVIFRHNGSPFVGKAMYALLYKYSEGKNNADTTGRFGTGFMTTITLSPIIEVKTDFIDIVNGRNELIGFQATMFRNGDTKEKLLVGLEKMRNSFRKTAPDGFTTFTYKLKTKINREARDLGYESFKNYVTQTLLFAPTINSTKFEYFNEDFNVKRGEVTKIDDISIILFEEHSTAVQKKRVFLMTSYNEPHKELSQKFGESRNLRLDVAIEIDEKYNIVMENNKTCLFSTFPFIGSEKHQLPFILNSPDFEPDEERQFLILAGEKFTARANEDNGEEKVISNPGINKEILLKSIILFTKLVNFVLDNNGHGFYVLTNGILTVPNINKMDEKWYSNYFIRSLRELLSDSRIIINNSNQKILLKEAYFPLYVSSHSKMSDQQKEQFYELVLLRYGSNCTCSFQESLNWENSNWEDLHFISLLDLTKEEEQFDDKYDDTHFKYLNNLLKFTFDYENQYLHEYSIIPNMNLEKNNFRSDFFECKKLHQDMIKILESLNTDWKKNHMHNEINGVKFPEHNMEDAINLCSQVITREKEKSYILVQYILPNNDRRKKIYDLTKSLLKKALDAAYECHFIEDSLWIQCDNFLINEMKDRILNYTKPEVESNISLINEFLGFLNSQPEKEYLKDYQLVPNKNFTKCKISLLRDRSTISENFKMVMNDCFSIDINDDEMNEKITEIHCKNQSTIKYYIDIIDEQFDNLEYEKKERATSILIRYLPDYKETDLYVKQKKIHQLYCDLVSKEELEKIPTNISKSKFWTKLNQFVINELIYPAISNDSTFSDFIHNNNLSEDQGIDVLNRCYEFISQGFNVPNQNGKMCEVQQLKCGKGIPKAFMKLIKYLNNEDYKEKVSDERINHPGLQNFDFISFYEKANNVLSKSLEKEEYKNDHKIKRILAQMNKLPKNESFTLNFFSKSDQTSAQRKLLANMYVANVLNRLMALQNPTENDQPRWGFELCQNAKDSISNTPGKRVQIIINVTDDKVIFQHNGNPFTQDTLLGLLYKFSEGKENNDKTTGKFGTGFLTTHALSKIVKLTSNFIESDGKIYRFSVHLDRRGSSRDQLIEGVQKMEDSFQIIENSPSEYTIFEYDISNKSGKDCAKLGLECLKKEIPLTLLFSHEIESVTIIENGSTLVYQLNEEKNRNDHNVFYVNYLHNQNIFEQKFILIERHIFSKKVNEFKKRELPIVVTGAIEIDENDHIISHENRDSLFCTFPLIGLRKQLPIVINSPEFETLTERNGLRLQKSDNSIVDDVYINKLIFHEVISIFREIVDVCINKSIKSLHLLTNGLNDQKYQSLNSSDFDEEWYHNEFIIHMQHVLLQSPIIETDKGFIKLQDAIIPIYEFCDKLPTLEAIEDYYNLVYFVFESKTITKSESINWHNRTWEGLHQVTLEELIKLAELIKLEDYSSSNHGNWEYLNNLLFYTCNNNAQGLITKYGIIPDMNMEKHKYLPSEFFECKNVNKDLINILDAIGSGWKSQHMHNGIYGIKLSDHGMNYAIHEVNNIVKEDEDKSMIVISYTNNVRERRKILFELSCIFLNNEYPETECEIEDEKIWEMSDKVQIKRIIQVIQTFDKQQISTKLADINQFLMFLSSQDLEKKYLDIEDIVPNAKCKLCKLSKLKGPSEISGQFKKMMKLCFDIHIKEEEIHPFSNKVGIECKSKSVIVDYINIIDDNFQNLDSDKKLACSITILHTLPNCESIDLFKKQKSLLEIYQLITKYEVHDFSNDFMKLVMNIKEEPSLVNNEKLWTLANNTIIDFLTQKISSFETLSTFINHYQLQTEIQAIHFLNKCYQYIQTGSNIPNFNGKMVSLDDKIFLSDNCPDDILEFIQLIEKDENIGEHLAMRGIIHPKINLYDVSLLYSKMHILFSNVIEDQSLKANPEIKKALNKLNFPGMNLQRSFFMTHELDTYSKEKLRLFSKIYIANIKPRLHELQSPSESVPKRCFYELTQNAKDTVSDLIEWKVDIKIILSNNEVKFTHNGKAFTQSAMLGLLYKFSEGKEDHVFSTGRFGTGFLTTHLLSPIVYVTGDVIIDDDEVHGFSVTLNRSGDSTTELMKGYDEMEASRKLIEDSFGETTFTYPLTEKTLHFAKQSIQNLKENLPFVLLFCKHLNEYTINDLGNIIEFVRINETADPIYEIEIRNTTNGTTNKRRFIKYSKKDESPELTELYGQNREIEIDIAVEIDENNRILSKANENLFCVFPLIGSENIKTPMVINSPNFETTTERDSIYLKTDSDDKISNVNKSILMKSVELFSNIITFCIDNNIGALYNLARNLDAKPHLEDSCSSDVFFEVFIAPLRELILDSRVFLSSQGKLERFNKVIIPNYWIKNQIGSLDFQQKYYFLIEKFYTQVILFSESIEWSKVMWNKFPSKGYVQFLQEVSNKERIQNLPFDNIDKGYTFMNDLINFVSKYDKQLFEKIALLPNQNHDFVLKSNKLALAPEVDMIIVNLIHELGSEWKATHVNLMITSQPINTIHTIHDAEKRIQDSIRSKNAHILMSYVIENNQLRQTMYRIVKHLFPNDVSDSSIILNKLAKDTWNTADQLMTDKIFKYIEDTGQITDCISVKWLSDSITFFMENNLLNELKLRKWKIFPNQNGKLVSFEIINQDGIQHDQLKELLSNYCHIDCRDCLIDTHFTADIPRNILYFNAYSDELISSMKYCLQPILEILIQYIDSKNSLKPKVIDIYNIVMKTSFIQMEIPEVLSIFTYNYLLKAIVSKICEKLKQYKHISEMERELRINENQCFEIFNYLYSLSERELIDLIPNQKGDICTNIASFYID